MWGGSYKNCEEVPLLLTIIWEDPNWYRAKNSTGREGTIPANYVQKREGVKSASKLSLMPWFHGKITREQAERLLYPPETGLFLVRESTNYPGDYTLCVSCDGKVEHYRIIYHDGRLSIDEEEYFENLMQLMERIIPGLLEEMGRMLQSCEMKVDHDVIC
ncbi:hypothetical protein DNTS_016354 [Danionella cerebrum]|uniref:SH2 domain-containing protein n=1 Tax=Danionella cerebrum TaxID=2873325 RepID=A0A553N1F8_9TELE|nr:hypothetical protein DNTS_016354 [Danionella translucida]